MADVTGPDGEITQVGIDALADYARAWVAGKRNLVIERDYPELEDAFYDIRLDGERAQAFAELSDLEKSLAALNSKPKKVKKPVTLMASQ